MPDIALVPSGSFSRKTRRRLALHSTLHESSMLYLIRWTALTQCFSHVIAKPMFRPDGLKDVG